MRRFPVSTISLLLLLLLTCLLSSVHAAITSASVTPASFNAGAASDVTVSFTVSVDVDVGGSVLVEFPIGFQVPSGTTVTVQVVGSSTTLSVASVTATQISVQVGGAAITSSVAFSFSIANVRNPGAQTTGDFSISTYDPSTTLLETEAAVPGRTIVADTLFGADVAPVSSDAGVAGLAAVTFTSAVELPVGSLVKVTFPNDFRVVCTALSDATNIDGTVTMDATDPVAIVEIVSTPVAVGAVVSFKLDGVTNPSARTTGTFMVATMDSSSRLFQLSNVLGGVPISSSTLGGADVAPVSSDAGVAGLAAVTFTSAVELPVGSLVKVTFPNDFRVVCTALSDATNIDGTVTMDATDPVAIVEIVSTPVAVGAVVSFKLDGVTNPSARTTGTFMVATMDSSSRLFQLSNVLGGVPISSSTLGGADVAPVSSDAGVAGLAAVTFTSAVELPVGSLVKVTFPNDFRVVCTALSDATNIDGTVTMDATDPVAIVEIVSTPVAVGAVVSFKLDGVTNPSARTTGTFMVATMDSSSRLFQLSNVLGGVPISSSTLGGADVAPVSSDAGVAGLAAVTFTSAVELPVGSLVKVTFPNDFRVVCTALSDATNIDGTVTMDATDPVAIVEIVSTPVAVGAVVSFKLDGVTNPSARTTGTFMVATMDSSSRLFQLSNVLGGVPISSSTLGGADVAPVSSDAGVAGLAAVTFTSAVELPVGSLVKVTFPNDFRVVCTALSDATNIDGTVTMDATDPVAIVEIVSTPVAVGAVVSFKLDGVTNPSARTTGTFMVATMDSSSRLFQLSNVLGGVPISSSTLGGADVAPVSSDAGVAGLAAVTFTSAVELPVGSLVKVTFPNDFRVVCTALSDATNIDGTVTMDATDPVAIVEIVSTPVAVGAVVSFKLDGVTNPSARTTGTFMVATMDSSSRLFQLSNVLGGVPISSSTLGGADVAPVSSDAGVAGLAAVTFTSAVELPVGSLVKVTFPNDFRVVCTALSDATNIDGTVTMDATDPVAIVEIVSTPVAVGAVVSFKLDGVTNPSARTTGTFMVATMDSSSRLFQLSNVLGGVPISSSTLGGADVAPVSSDAGVAGLAAVTFTSAVELPVGSLVKVTFPNDFRVVCTALSDATNIDGTVTMDATDPVAIVEIVSTPVAVGAVVSFKLDGVTNPSARTTGTFMVATMDSSSRLFQLSNVLGGVPISSSTLGGADVAPVSSDAGVAGLAAVTFTSAVELPVGSLVKVTFPNDFRVVCTALSDATNIDGTVTMDATDPVAIVEIVSTPVAVGAVVSFKLDGVTNPSARTTGTFMVATMDSSSRLFQLSNVLGGVPISSSTLGGADVAPVSSDAGVAGLAAVTFTSAVELPVGSLVKVTFPNDFRVVCTALSDATNIDGTVTMDATDPVAIVEIVSTPVAVGAVVSFKLDGVTNPSARTTGTFMVATMDSSSRLFQLSNVLGGVPISSSTLGGADVAPVSSDAGVAGLAAVTFTSAVELPVGSLVKVTFPNDFRVVCTALSDATNIDGTVTMDATDPVAIVEIVSTPVAVGAVVSFKLDGVTNPSARTTGTFMVATMDSSSRLFQLSNVLGGVPISSSTLGGADVAPVSSDAGVAGLAAVTFTSAVELPVGSLVKVTFPNDFRVVCTALSDATNIDGTVTMDATDPVAIVEIVSTPVAVGAVVSFKLDGVTNPSARTTGTFMVATMDSSSRLFQLSNVLGGVPISSSTLGGADVAPVSSDAGVAGLAAVTFTSAVELPVGSLVKVTFPNDFRVVCTALSDATNIDGTVTMDATDPVAIVEIVSTPVAVGAVVSFKLDGVTNPSARTTGTFMVATMDSSSRLFQLSNVLGGVPISSSTLGGADVAPVSSDAGVAGLAAVTFTSAVELPVGSLVKVTFPNDFRVVCTALSDATNIDGTVTMDATDPVAIVEIINTPVAVGAVVSFKLDGVTNPSARTTGTFMVATMDNSLFLYEESDPINGAAIEATTLTSAAVTIDNLNGGVVGTATVSFSSAVELPVTSLIKVTFPSDFQVAPTAVTDDTNIDVNSGVQVAGSVVTIKIANIAVTTGIVSFKLDGVTNPGGKTTGAFGVETLDSSLLLFQQSDLIPGATIVTTTLADATVTPDSLEAGVEGTATVKFTSSVGLPVGSLVKITFPSGFSVAATTMSSASNIDGNSAVQTSGLVVTVTIANTVVVAGASVSFELNGVTNPGTTTTGKFGVATTDSSSNIFEQAMTISGVAIEKTTLVSAAVTLDSLNAGVVGKVAISFSSAVALPFGSFVRVKFPDDFQVASSALSDTTNIDGTVAVSGTEVIISITPNAVALGAAVSFKVDGVTNPGAKTTGTFAVSTLDSSSNPFQQSDPVAAVTIKSTTLVGVSVHATNDIAGVESCYQFSFEMNAAVPVGGYIILMVPVDYTLDGSITLVDTALSTTWDGTINGQGIKFKALSSYAAGPHTIQVEFLQNPGVSTTGTFTLSTTDANEFLLESSGCGGVQIVPGSITDAVLTPQLAHPGVVSRVDISFTASAGLADGSRLDVYLPPGDYNAAVPILSVAITTPSGLSATASWDNTNTAIRISLTSLTTISHGAAVFLQVTALKMPQSIRALSLGTIESSNAGGLQLDKSSTLTLSAITAVKGLPCTWATETPNPGITSNVLVTFKSNGMIPVGGKIVLTLPVADFYADSVGNGPSVVFKNPSTVVVAASTWDKTTSTLEMVISGDSIPAYKTGVQVKILKLDTPMSVRTASRVPASLTTFDPLGIEIDGPSVLQLDAITAGFILGSRLWTAVDAVPGVTSAQTVSFSITGRMDPGGKFEFTLPSTQWAMAATAVATFTSPNLGAVGSVVWSAPMRMMIVTLTGTTSIPAYSSITLTIKDVTNPPKETGINNAYLTTRASDDSIIDGPDTISVMTISRGVLTGSKSWTSVTTASASMKSDQLLSFTVSGALPSGGIILVVLPGGGWRMVDNSLVSVLFSLPTTGVTVQSATWSVPTYELRIVTSGDLAEATPVKLLVKDMINPFSSSTATACSVITMLADSGVVDESKDIAINPIISEVLPTEGSWTSTKSTPGVLSTQTLTFTTGGKLEPSAKFCIAGDVWTLMASTSASLSVAGGASSSLLKLTFDKASSTLCMHTPVGIDFVTDVSIVLTDILSPQSVRLDRTEPLTIHSHLGGDVNSGLIRLNAVTEGALSGPLTWKTLFFTPGPVAGLKTSANLALKTTGRIDAGGYFMLELPTSWVMASTCEVTFVSPSILCKAQCNQNKVSILLQDSLDEATSVDILFVGVYNPATVIPEGTASVWTLAPDGGKIDESAGITTGAVMCAVTGITNSGDHLVAVAGVSKPFAFQGSSLAQNDVIKFVDASTTSDSNCGASTTGQSDVGGIGVKYLGANQEVTLKFTQSSPDRKPFAICYKFGDNPFKLYPALSITVKEITSITADAGSSDVAVADFVKTWKFDGNGIVTGDQVRWIDVDVVESAAYVSTPPDCLDTSTLAKLSAPTSGTLTTPEDDYTRVVGVDTASYAFSVQSSGKTYCLCYKFGNEPFKVYPSMKVQVNHLRSIEATSTGSDTVAVVNAPKTFMFFGDGVSLNDRLYFVEKDSVASCAESNNDPTLQLTNLINEQVQSTLFINGDFVTSVNFEPSAAGMVVVPCFQFSMEPHQLYSDIRLTVKMVTKYTGTLGSPQLAVAGVPEPLTFLGFGLNEGDKVRWILRGEEDCESSLASLSLPTTQEVVETITLDNNNAGLFSFTSTQSDFNPVLCYKFGEENFMRYPSISIGIGTIRGKAALTGANDVAVVGSRKMFTLLGTNLAVGDRIGWTSVLDSTPPCSKLSLLIANPLNTDNDYLSYLTSDNTLGVSMASLSSGERVYLCYGFGVEPFKLFTDLYLNVKSVANMRALVASPSVAVAGAMKTFLFDGDGVATGDFAKFVSSESDDCSVPGVTLLNIMKEFDDYDEMAMYLYEIGDSTTTGSFQVSSDKNSAGLGRALCYRFGVEPFAYYENFRIDVKTIWGLHRTDKTVGGQDNVMVVNEPKQMTIDGVGISVKDALKFVNATADSNDADCVHLPAKGQNDGRLQVNADLTVWLSFDSGSEGGTWALCYKFDDEPYRLYPLVAVTVKQITAFLDYTFQDIEGLGAVATIGHRKQWKPMGSGILAGDKVKIVPQSVSSSIDCGKADANAAPGTSVMTVGAQLTFAGIISAYPSSTSDVYHLCYQFQDEPFTYIGGFTLATFGIMSLDHTVVLASATTSAHITGFRLSDTDEMGWTTSSTSCSSMLGRTEVSGSKANIFFEDSYSQLYLCYSFDRQPFDIFKTVALVVTKAEIWSPQTVSIIADQTTAVDVFGTFGITQGTDQIAWVPSDVVACSSDAVALYADVMQSSVKTVAKSQSIMPRAGDATFNAKYVAPSSSSGIAATDSFSTWKLCYRFGTTPNYLMFGDVLCTVLNIGQAQLISLDPTSSGAVMKFEFDGIGMQDFDAAKWVDALAASTDEHCSSLPTIGGSKVTDVVNSRATFTFTEESTAMALCYRFLGHAFKLYANIPIQSSIKSSASTDQSATGVISTSYDEEAIAAASDQFTASRDIATVSLTLDKDINEIPAGSIAERDFKASFVATLATSLGIDPARIQIAELAAGSVVVNFQLLASDNPADPSVSEAVQDLHFQLTDSNSNLLSGNTIVVKNPATALRVALTTPPAPTTSSVAIQALGYQSNGLFSFVRSIYSVTEKSSTLVIPITRLQGTASVMSITVQIQTVGTSAIYGQDYDFPASATFDGSLKLLHLKFEIGQMLQTIQLDILDNDVKGVHFKTLSLALRNPLTPGAMLGSTKETVIRIYDYDEGLVLAKSSFTTDSAELTNKQEVLQGWQVVANGANPLRVDSNGLFAVDEVLSEAEYNQKCDLAAPTGVCTYACELGGGLTTSDGLESAYNVLVLDEGDYTASATGISAFPTEAFTVSLWVKTTQLDPGACLYSYAVNSAKAPAVPLALCNPSNLQLFVNAESDASGLATFVNISDNAWHFLAVTWNSADGRVRVFDNGMLVFDGGPYREGKTVMSNGFLVVGHLSLSSALKAPCTSARSVNSAATGDTGALLSEVTEDAKCEVVSSSGFKGQVQHVHVWSRVLARTELLGELAWPLRVVSNGLVLGWNFDSSFLLEGGRVVNDLSMQGQEQKNLGVLHCTSQNATSLQLTSTLVANTSSTGVSGCLRRGEVPRLDDTFPCGPVFSNVWYFLASPTFITKLSAAYGGRLQFRLLAPSFNGSPRPRRGQIVIFGKGAGGKVVQISTALGSFDLPSASRWTYYSVVFREDFGWITEPDGVSLTAATFKAVLDGATALWIRGDIWGYDSSGPGQEVVYINDIVLFAR